MWLQICARPERTWKLINRIFLYNIILFKIISNARALEMIWHDYVHSASSWPKSMLSAKLGWLILCIVYFYFIQSSCKFRHNVSPFRWILMCDHVVKLWSFRTRFGCRRFLLLRRCVHKCRVKWSVAAAWTPQNYVWNSCSVQPKKWLLFTPMYW